MRTMQGVLVTAAIAAVVLGANAPLAAEEAETANPEAPVTVVIATRDLAVGEVVTSGDLAQLEVPAKYVTSSVVKPDSASYIVDQKVQVPVLKGDFILWSAFETTTVGEASQKCFEVGAPGKTAAEQVARMRARLVAPSKK